MSEAIPSAVARLALAFPVGANPDRLANLHG